jgi:prepilin-type N-terminal cleavage/methylation domain-containing protein
MKKRAFTLIELLVVVSIILIVAATAISALHRGASRRSGGTTGATVNTGDSSQSPLNASVAPPAQPEYSGTQFRISNPEDAALMKTALQRAGFKVEPVTDKINLVYKPQ